MVAGRQDGGLQLRPCGRHEYLAVFAGGCKRTSAYNRTRWRFSAELVAGSEEDRFLLFSLRDPERVGSRNRKWCVAPFDIELGHERQPYLFSRWGTDRLPVRPERQVGSL